MSSRRLATRAGATSSGGAGWPAPMPPPVPTATASNRMTAVTVVIDHVLSHCSYDELLAAACVCQRWRRAVDRQPRWRAVLDTPFRLHLSVAVEQYLRSHPALCYLRNVPQPGRLGPELDPADAKRDITRDTKHEKTRDNKRDQKQSAAAPPRVATPGPLLPTALARAFAWNNWMNAQREWCFERALGVRSGAWYIDPPRKPRFPVLADWPPRVITGFGFDAALNAQQPLWSSVEAQRRNAAADSAWWCVPIRRHSRRTIALTEPESETKRKANGAGAGGAAGATVRVAYRPIPTRWYLQPPVERDRETSPFVMALQRELSVYLPRDLLLRAIHHADSQDASVAAADASDDASDDDDHPQLRWLGADASPWRWGASYALDTREAWHTADADAAHWRSQLNAADELPRTKAMANASAYANAKGNANCNGNGRAQSSATDAAIVEAALESAPETVGPQWWHDPSPQRTRYVVRYRSADVQNAPAPVPDAAAQRDAADQPRRPEPLPPPYLYRTECDADRMAAWHAVEPKAFRQLFVALRRQLSGLIATDYAQQLDRLRTTEPAAVERAFERAAASAGAGGERAVCATPVQRRPLPRGRCEPNATCYALCWVLAYCAVAVLLPLRLDDPQRFGAEPHLAPVSTGGAIATFERRGDEWWTWLPVGIAAAVWALLPSLYAVQYQCSGAAARDGAAAAHRPKPEKQKDEEAEAIFRFARFAQPPPLTIRERAAVDRQKRVIQRVYDALLGAMALSCVWVVCATPWSLWLRTHEPRPPAVSAGASDSAMWWQCVLSWPLSVTLTFGPLAVWTSAWVLYSSAMLCVWYWGHRNGRYRHWLPPSLQPDTPQDVGLMCIGYACVMAQLCAIIFACNASAYGAVDSVRRWMWALGPASLLVVLATVWVLWFVVFGGMGLDEELYRRLPRISFCVLMVDIFWYLLLTAIDGAAWQYCVMALPLWLASYAPAKTIFEHWTCAED